MNQTHLTACGPRRWATRTLLVVLLANCTGRCWAEEPAAQFLKALLERGYHDLALDYLDRMQQSDLAPAAFRQTLLYQRGVTLVASASRQRDLKLREKQLDAAQTSLEQFVAQNPQHPMVASAKRQFGNLLVQRGRMKIDLAKQGPPGRHLTESRELYAQALEVFEASREELKGKLFGLNRQDLNPETQKREIQQRDELRTAYLESQLLYAAVLEEMADTTEEGSKPYNEQLSKATAEFKGIYEKYHSRLAGLYARMYEGRCYQKMKKFDEALSYYTADLLSQPDSPDPFRVLKTKTLLLAMDCWLDESQKKHAEAINQAGEWLGKIRPNEARDPDWMNLKLKLARAHKLYADHLKATKPRDKQINRSIVEARNLAKVIARLPGPLQGDARQLLSQLPGGLQQSKQAALPKTFAEAKTAGSEALSAMRAAEFVLQNVPQRIAKESDEQLKAELQRSVDEAEENIAVSRERAIELFRAALALADAQTPGEDVNMTRYFLAFLFFSQGDYFESAVLGELVARRYSGSAAAKPCAQIAMAAYLRLYSENETQDKQFESRRAVQIAEYIADTWPEQPEAVEALNTLIPFMIQAGDIQGAQDCLERIPEDSPLRGGAEVKTGQAMWSSYLSGSKTLRSLEEQHESNAADAAAVEARMQQQRTALEALRQGALKVLGDGIRRAGETGKVDHTVSAAVLSLAQIQVDTEQCRKAIALLDEGPLALLPLLEKKDPAVGKPGFAEETYKTALRAYIGALPTASDAAESDRLMANAKDCIEALKQSVGTSPDGQKKLVAIYFSLARDLEQQLELIQSQHDKARLAQGFATFLAEVAAETTELNVLNWVAQSYGGLGKGFELDDAKVSPEAQKYFAQAIETYQSILDRARSQNDWASPQIQMQIRYQMALVQRQTGQFDQAVAVFKEILGKDQESNMKVNIQIEAARTYQQWARVPGKSSQYRKAIQGEFFDRKARRNTIWGWNTMSKLVSKHAQFRDTFHLARFNLATCHYQYALRKKDKKERRKYLNYAKQTITNTAMLYPKMGGEKWRPQYDSFLKRIQKDLSEKPTGLKALTSTKS